MIKEIINSNDLKKYISTNNNVILEFYAPWCKYCFMLNPILEEISNEYQTNINFCKINTDENTNISSEYNISTLPTILIIKNGTILDRHTGFLEKEQLQDIISKNFKEG